MYHNTRLPFTILLLLFLFPSSGGEHPSLGAQEADGGPDLPHLSITDTRAGTPVFSPCSGELLAVESDAPWGLRIIISTTENYFLNGEKKRVEYQLVIGGLREVSADTGEIKSGDPLGNAAKNMYLSARIREPDAFMVRESNQVPVFRDGLWWFSPDWLINGSTIWLSFRQVESFSDAVEDFIYRWEREKNEPLGCTVHFFPEFDRIRIYFPLTAYPEPISNRTECLSVAENVFYGISMVHTHESLLQVGKRNVILYWQKGFEGYLRKEYTPGQDLWLYLSIVALNHERDTILVFIRDFAQAPDEKVIEKRLEIIKEKQNKINDSTT